MARMKLVSAGIAALIVGFAATSLQAAPLTGVAEGVRSAALASSTDVTKTTFDLFDRKKRKRAHHHKHRHSKKYHHHHRKHKKHRH
jgi:hypothetical protein